MYPVAAGTLLEHVWLEYGEVQQRMVHYRHALKELLIY
jgi:hypothetical protein